MRSRHNRRLALVAALLALSLLTLAAGQFVSHEGHGGTLDKNCVACRWAADSVAESAATVVLSAGIEPLDVLAAPNSARIAPVSPEAASSRGPPLA